MYQTLNDAQIHDPIFRDGDHVKVWYVNPNFHRSFCMGARMAAEFDNNFIDITDMTKTHVLVGSFAGSPDLTADDVAGIMQGECWSPNGEARDLIQSLGLHHTSFMSGDVIQIGDTFYTTDRWAIVEFNNDYFKKA